MVVRETPDGRFLREFTTRRIDDLPPGDVLLRVRYSSLNYKDALSATGNKGVTRRYPHTPGIDAAGVVEESSSQRFRPGEEVLVSGFELGSNHAGGFAEFVRVPADWVVRKPAGLSLRESMILGTAGFTAGLSVHRLLQHGVAPGQGPLLVTGATGGVGSIAVAILARAGFEVVAVTGKADAGEFLHTLGAGRILSREEATDRTGRALLSGLWAGAVDTVGGSLLDTAIRQTRPEGAIACCGNIGSTRLETSIYPFILRGVALIGIDSAFAPAELRLRVWENLSGPWKIPHLEMLATEVALEELNPLIDRILAGGIRGRTLVTLGR
jgi:acrylyl-CoA reductase (NADPH)